MLKPARTKTAMMNVQRTKIDILFSKEFYADSTHKPHDARGLYNGLADIISF
jgi:hypothetical protein